MYNESKYICVRSKGIIISKRDDAYKFLIKATLDMAGGTETANNIHCVASDGYFN